MEVFNKKAGYIRFNWLPHFVNACKNGYDFDARWDWRSYPSRTDDIKDSRC